MIIKTCFCHWLLRSSCGGLAALVVVGLMAVRIDAQELEPRAYVPAPVNLNVLVGAVTLNTGDLAFDPSGPISDASANIGIAVPR